MPRIAEIAAYANEILDLVHHVVRHGTRTQLALTAAAQLQHDLLRLRKPIDLYRAAFADDHRRLPRCANLRIHDRKHEPRIRKQGIPRRFEAAVEKRGTRYDLPLRLAEDHECTAYRIYPEIEQRRIPERAVEGVHPLARKKAVVPRRILREFKPRRAYRSDLAECGPYPCDRRIVRRAHRLREYGSAPFGSGDRRLKRYFIRGGGLFAEHVYPVTEKILRLRNVERVRRRNVYRIERPFLIRRARLVQRGEYALRAEARSKGFAGLLSARKHRRDAGPVKPAHGIGEIVGYEIRSDYEKIKITSFHTSVYRARSPHW